MQDFFNASLGDRPAATPPRPNKPPSEMFSSDPLLTPVVGEGKPIVVVLGATGQQGGSVVSALQDAHNCRIRGVCRGFETAECRELESQGVEMNMMDIAMASDEDVECIFQNAYGAFIMTDSNDPSTWANETACGLKVLEAAEKAKVQSISSS